MGGLYQKTTEIIKSIWVRAQESLLTPSNGKKLAKKMQKWVLKIQNP